MNGGSSASVDKLVGNNYSFWKLCMEAYLQGQDLWDLISGDDELPADTTANVEARRKWKIKCGKALFVLHTSISMDYIEHVRDVKTSKEVWETLERLFTQKNTMRLQFLENELDRIVQELDTDESVKDARLRRYLIRGLPLVKQMVGVNKQSASPVEDALYAKDKGKGKCGKTGHMKRTYRVKVKCDRCGKPGHIQRNYHVDLARDGVEVYTNVFTDVNKEWIVDSGCSHHATGDESLLSNARPHTRKKVIVTADNSLHPVVKEETVCIDKDVSLEDVYHVPGLKKNLASVSQITDSGRDIDRRGDYYIFVKMIEELITRSLILVFGYAYPAFQCFKTLEKNKVAIPELRFWCQYWIIVAALSVLERFLDIFISWIPFYRGIKLIMYIYLWHPGTKGSSYIYDTLVQPYVARHETTIDRGIAELKERIWNFMLSYWYNCADMSSKKVLQCLQLLMAQLMNAALSRPQPQAADSHQSNEAPSPTPPSTPSGIFKRNVSEKRRPPVPPLGNSPSSHSLTPKSDSFKVKLNNDAQFIHNEDVLTPNSAKQDGDQDFLAARVKLRRVKSKE
ncbi:hypothetical protein C2S52_022112 [Perilla frutescens var. hirtella]|nr:hypothetical protein C2S52_022112 [Perilla frutescens var. hirtella]